MTIFYRGFGGLFIGSLLFGIVLCLIFRNVNPGIWITLGVVGALGIQIFVIKEPLWDNHIMFIPLPAWSVILLIGYINWMLSADFSSLGSSRRGPKQGVKAAVQIVENIRFPETPQGSD